MIGTRSVCCYDLKKGEWISLNCDRRYKLLVLKTPAALRLDDLTVKYEK